MVSIIQNDAQHQVKLRANSFASIEAPAVEETVTLIDTLPTKCQARRRIDDSNKSDIAGPDCSSSLRSINTLDQVEAAGLTFLPDYDTEGQPSPVQRFSLDDETEVSPASNTVPRVRPFDKWLKHIHRSTGQREVIQQVTQHNEFLGCDGTTETNPHEAPTRAQKHVKSQSDSSTGFVEGMRSASMTLASLSLAPRSRRTTLVGRANKSTRGRFRSSESDDAGQAILANDHMVTNRALQRHRILNELLTTEESYVADITFLASVSVRLLNYSIIFVHRLTLCSPGVRCFSEQCSDSC